MNFWKRYEIEVRRRLAGRRPVVPVCSVCRNPVLDRRGSGARKRLCPTCSVDRQAELDRRKLRKPGSRRKMKG